MLALHASSFKQFKTTLGNSGEIFETNLAQMLEKNPPVFQIPGAMQLKVMNVWGQQSRGTVLKLSIVSKGIKKNQFPIG